MGRSQSEVMDISVQDDRDSVKQYSVSAAATKQDVISGLKDILRRGGDLKLLMHSMYAVADIGYGLEVLKLYVEEINNPNASSTIKRAYQLQNIEKASAVNGGVQGNANSSLANTTNAINTVADLFAAVKQMDTNFQPNPVSKVVNEDGTPMVVYHGTSDQFTEFKHSELSDKHDIISVPSYAKRISSAKQIS